MVIILVGKSILPMFFLIQDKEAFETLSESHSVSIKAYHADNRTFVEFDFRYAVDAANQKISFLWHWCSSSEWSHGAAHWYPYSWSSYQLSVCPAKVEQSNRDYSLVLCLCDFGCCWNLVHLDENGWSPLNHFTGVNVCPNLKGFHPFRCPVFILEKDYSPMVLVHQSGILEHIVVFILASLNPTFIKSIAIH